MNATHESPSGDSEGYAIPMDTLPRRYTWLGQWRDLLIVVQALHDLVAARFPLAEGLLHLSQDAPNRRLWHVFYWLHRELQGGAALNEAMLNRPEFFPPFCVDLVRAGEESGQLEEALRDLHQELSDSLEFRRTLAGYAWFLVNSCVWPLFLTINLIVFVVPQFAEIYNQFEVPLNPLMRCVIELHQLGLSIALLCAAIALPILWTFAEYSFIRGGSLARQIGALSAWVPGLGRSLRKRHLANAAAMAARLLQAGAPLPDALRSAAGASASGLCRKSLARIAQRVESGLSLKESMEAERWILPASFRTLVAMGESSGNLPDALQQLGALYRSQTACTARLAVAIGMPLLVCINGAIVCAVYGAIITTIMGLPALIQ